MYHDEHLRAESCILCQHGATYRYATRRGFTRMGIERQRHKEARAQQNRTGSRMSLDAQSSYELCFDRSAASVAHYVHSVYGVPSPAVIEGFKFSALTVLYSPFLRPTSATLTSGNITQCLLQSERVYKRIFMNVFWVNYRSHASMGLVPYDAFINSGGPTYKLNGVNVVQRLPCRVAHLGWMEVLHLPSWSNSRPYQVSWGNQFWMYVVNGSGLWYNAGRTLLCGDTMDLVDYLNYSKYRRRVGDTKPPLFEEAIRRLNHTFDSISFDMHVDGACCHRMTMHEIFSLHRSTMSCPVNDRLRRGFPPHLRACDCAEDGRYATLPSPPRTCPSDKKPKDWCDKWVTRLQSTWRLEETCNGYDPSFRESCAGTCCRRSRSPFGQRVENVRNLQPVC